MKERFNNIFKDELKEQKNFAKKFNYYGGQYDSGLNYSTSSFFAPFQSKDDARRNLKAVVLQPFVDAYLMLKATEEALLHFSVGLGQILVGLVTLDVDGIKDGATNMGKTLGNLVQVCYYGLSIVGNASIALLQLITHSLGTLYDGAKKMAGQTESIPPSYESVGGPHL